MRTLPVCRFCLLLLWRSHRVFAQDLAQYDLFLFERQSCTGSVLRVPPSFLEYSLTVLSQHSERFQLLSTSGCRVFRIAFQTDQKTKSQTFSLAGQTSFAWSVPFPHSGPGAFQCRVNHTARGVRYGGMEKGRKRESETETERERQRQRQKESGRERETERERERERERTLNAECFID